MVDFQALCERQAQEIVLLRKELDDLRAIVKSLTPTLVTASASSECESQAAMSEEEQSEEEFETVQNRKYKRRRLQRPVDEIQPALPPPGPEAQTSRTAPTPTLTFAPKLAPAPQPRQRSRGIIEPVARMPAPPPQPPRVKPPPPIILRDTSKWQPVHTFMVSHGVKHTAQRMANGNIKIAPEIPAGYREIHDHLTKANIPFHTFQLEEDKSLRVIIRGIGDEVTTADIGSELKTRGYPVKSVTRLTNRTRKLDLYHVQLIKNDKAKEIFDLYQLCGLKVRVEAKRRNANIGQCHRCQMYGHSASNCNAAFICVKCGENHPTAACTRPREVPATCVLCGGAHPASYRGCRNAPKPRRHISYAGAARARTNGPRRQPAKQRPPNPPRTTEQPRAQPGPTAPPRTNRPNSGKPTPVPRDLAEQNRKRSIMHQLLDAVMTADTRTQALEHIFQAFANLE